jgi:predicted RNA-binding protein YlxR (DUF448 family)
LLATVEHDETDDGPGATRKDRARLCLATRAVTPVAEMIRYVVAPDGTIVPDLEGKLPGRGAWITATRPALEKALASGAFGRAFRGKGAASAELPALVERLLEKGALGALSLANKAGQVIAGFAKVEAALREKKVAAIVNARDAAPDGIRKLDAGGRAAAAAGRGVPARIGSFDGAQLDLALGRPNVVHAALLVHPASTSFLARCQRLDRWRNGAAEAFGPPPQTARDEIRLG